MLNFQQSIKTFLPKIEKGMLRKEKMVKESRKNGLKLLLILASLIVLTLLEPAITDAVGVGVSPAIVYFDNMLRDGYAERIITVSVSAAQQVPVSVSAGGEIASWLNFSSQFIAQPGQPYKLKLIIRPPADVANGVYGGSMKVTTSDLGNVTSEVGSVVQAGVEFPISVTVTDRQIKECKAGGANAASAEKDEPVIFSYSVLNEGNVRIRPPVSVVVWDQEQLLVQLPTDELEIGQYWADFSVTECLFSQLLTFDVVEKGSFASDGILHNIVNKPYSDKGETVPVHAFFENVGEVQYLARFKGNVEFGEKVIELLESEELLVLPGEKVNFSIFYAPQESGRHIIRGRVFYGSKRTFEKFSILNVTGRKVDFLLVGLYTAVVALVAFIIYRLYRRKKRVY